MRRVFRTHRAAASAAVALLLAATISCNDIGEDGDSAEAVPLVTSITFAGLSVSAPGDTTASLTVMLEDRTGSATSFFNDVDFTDYRVTFTPAGTPPDIIGVFNTTFCSIGSSCVLMVTLVDAADKAAIVAPTVVFGVIHVEGRDVQNRKVTFDAAVGLPFTI